MLMCMYYMYIHHTFTFMILIYKLCVYNNNITVRYIHFVYITRNPMAHVNCKNIHVLHILTCIPMYTYYIYTYADVYILHVYMSHIYMYGTDICFVCI